MAVLDPSETSPRTAWLQRDTALRRFLQTETASAALLLGAAVSALIWANVDASSYDRVWQTRLSLHVGQAVVSLDLRGWINSGLMSFFFLVFGLAGLGGMLGAVGLYLAINAGRTSAHGWGVAMSTDTAFALGLLALLGKHA